MYSEPCQISKTEFFANIVNDFKLFTVFAKSFILNTWQGSECTYDLLLRVQLTAPQNFDDREIFQPGPERSYGNQILQTPYKHFNNVKSYIH